jgi:hypothetical protein
MLTRVVVACALTFVIDLIATLSYSVRIVGVRTRRIALSIALFNVMVLISRAANTLQAPLLAKNVELNVAGGESLPVLPIMRLVLASATIATVVGAVLIPTFQRLFTIGVRSYGRHGSFLRLVSRATSREGLVEVIHNVVLPRSATVAGLVSWRGIPVRVVLANVVVVAIACTATLSALGAGYLHPDLRVTAGTLTGVVNGAATVLLYLLVDPYLARLTDEVASGARPEGTFRRFVACMVGARFLGTLLAQALLLPAARAISAIALAI